MLRTLAASLPLSLDVALPWLATQTAGLAPADLVALVADAQAAAALRVATVATAAGVVVDAAAAQATPTVLAADFARALGRAQGAQADAVGAAKVC